MKHAREAPTMQTQVGSGAALLQGAPLISDGRKPRQYDATGGPCLDLMVHHPGPIMHEFLCAMDFVIIGSGLLDSPSSPSPPVSWGQVENNVL
jgi:hypothetical protein